MKVPDPALFCHTHEDYMRRTTEMFKKQDLALFPVSISVSPNIDRDIILMYFHSCDTETIVDFMKNHEYVIETRILDSWEYTPSDFALLDDCHRVCKFLCVGTTCLHGKDQSITNFCSQHRIDFRHHAVLNGRDYFSLRLRLKSNYVDYLNKLQSHMRAFGNLYENDDMLQSLQNLAEKYGCTDYFGRMLFVLFKNMSFKDEDLRVYFRSRAWGLFHNYSSELAEKCAYSINMDSSKFKEQFWNCLLYTSDAADE